MTEVAPASDGNTSKPLTADRRRILAGLALGAGAAAILAGTARKAVAADDFPAISRTGKR